MSIPDILTLDFDGVLCDGMQEYFEASRRTYMRIWPDEPAPRRGAFSGVSRPPTGDHDRLGDALAATRAGARARSRSHVAALGSRAR